VAAISAALMAFIIVVVYFVLPPPALDRSRSASALVLAADGSILRGFLTPDGKWRLPVEPKAVDPLYRRMLVAAEDRRFDRHPGADLIAAARALFQL
jgi:penicillin-binding protein 1C